MIEFFLHSANRFGSELSFSCAVAAITGLLSHSLYFIHGIRNPETIRYIIFFPVALCALFVKTVASLGLLKGLVAYCAISSSYFAALFLSIGAYRLFFHRLRRFPGPLAARISKLYGPWIARHAKLPDEYRTMHAMYGEFVRVGPNEISVLNVDAFPKIHGPLTKCSKKNTGPYDANHFRGEPNLDTILTNDEHRDRRKIWDQSMNTKSQDHYEHATRAVIQTWMGRLDELNGKPINTSLYAMLIPFDNMGRVGFSKDFGTVSEGRRDRMLDIIQASFKTASKFGQLAWPAYVLASLPKFGMIKEFETLSESMVDRRIKIDSEDTNDMVKFFLEDLNSEKPKSFKNKNVVCSDAQAILVGATDTIACALGVAFYFLARDANLRRQLYEAIAPLHGKTLAGEFVASDLVDVECLDAFIKETLRMYTPAAMNGPRLSPPEGVEVGGTWIPGSVILYTPLHVYHRSSKFWKQPNEFIPERWTTQPDLIIDKRAFQPFSYGRYDCVGKRLAWNVLRLTLSYTLLKYDFKFAPGEDGLSFEKNISFQIIQKPGALECVFEARERA